MLAGTMILPHIILIHLSYDCLILCPDIHGLSVLVKRTEVTINRVSMLYKRGLSPALA